MRVTGKYCLNCGEVLFYPYGHEKLLEHDKKHGEKTGWLRCTITQEVTND